MTLYNALNRAVVLLGQSARRREAEARDAASSQAAVDLRLSAGHDREAANILGEHLLRRLNFTIMKTTTEPPDDREAFLESPTCRDCNISMSLKEDCEWPDDPRLWLCDGCAHTALAKVTRDAAELLEALKRAVKHVPGNAVDAHKALTHPVAECRTLELCYAVIARAEGREP